MRVNLISTVLTLKSLGIDDVLNFEYMDRPNQTQLEQSLKQLYLLGAINNKGRLTALGVEFSKFPIEPDFALALLYAYMLGQKLAKSKHQRNIIADDMLKLVSVLSSENIWMNVSRHDIKGQ